MANSTKKNASRDIDDFIADMGDIALEKVYDLTDKKNEKIRKLNLPNLIQVLVKSVLSIGGRDPSGNNVSYTAADKSLIRNFVSDFNTTVGHFMDFLDYNDDNQVQLVNFEKKSGQIDIGEDLQGFLDDMKDIGTFKPGATASDKVFSVLSKVFLYLLSDEYSESKEDIVNFNSSVKVTYASLKALKDINHNKVFDSRVDDMVSFIITFCVILIPVVEYVNLKLAELNRTAAQRADDNDDNDNGEGVAAAVEAAMDDVLAEQMVITNDELVGAIKEAYGDKLDDVLLLVNQLTKKMSKVVESSKWKKFKQKCCCCCGSSAADE
jgi:hypothetical protein